MQTQVKEWGNSQGIRLPKEVLKSAGIALNEILDVTVSNGVLTMIWALPLSISYIKTKNVYVPMTAHFIGNLFGNGIDIIFTIIAMISNG